ncbi:MAG: transketolase [Candidatus Gastranaerophilales bacterium]|nr:transketolase [Candidatus Gastranaerophilales bacterium]
MTQQNLSEKDLKDLQIKSQEVRRNVLKMIHNAASGHPGGALSCTDILVNLYFKSMNHYSDWDKDSQWQNRDRFVLSKGHASAALYAVLAECGYFDKKELLTFRKFGSKLQGHPSFGLLPGVEVSTGSLGQGLSISCGISLGLKLDKKQSRVYVLLGDGETQEGSVWEAAMNAAHHQLNNLIAFVDRNNLQIDGCTENIKSLNSVKEKWQSFGWNVIEIDGHNHQEIFDATQKSIALSNNNQKPSAIIANTIKGKGVSYMENNHNWHGKALNDNELKIALEELKG